MSDLAVYAEELVDGWPALDEGQLRLVARLFTDVDVEQAEAGEAA